MLINLKVKTLDAQTHEFSIENEITVREFKDKVADKTNIAAENQRIIYCGRVLVDEKQLKDYSLDGKVLHVAERPPPSQRRPSTPRASNGGDRERRTAGMRNSPLFRALDGIVVGSMSLPNGQPPNNPFTSSSSFCMNRITVARHMLDCANNIANYLEDPERGLNNISMDILSRGRWTMESTVVEVGITAAELPHAQNFAEIVQDAVTAALNRNSGTNVTVVQLPTVFGSNEGDNAADTSMADSSQSVGDGLEEGASNSSDVSNEATAAVIIENVVDLEEDAATNASSSAAQAGSTASIDFIDLNNINTTTTTGGGNNSTSTGTNTDGNSARRHTRTIVLAEVIQQMRAVQTRLNPFVDQFYSLLLNDPTFEENDTVGRFSSQRLYDRISEAFHYLSHAQHAISDLMLDISQPAPRFLTCRPILVEQSGYVSTNSYLNSANAFGEARHHVTSRQQPQTQTPTPTPTPENGVNENNTAANTSAATANTSIPTAIVPPTRIDVTATAQTTNTSNVVVDDPSDEPIIIDSEPADAIDPDQANDNRSEMERLFQAVVNSAPRNAEFHVQIGVPMDVTISAPRTATANNANATPQQQAAATAAGGGNRGNNNNNNNAANTAVVAAAIPRASQFAAIIAAAAANQARVNTVTLPTTSTQTRSTSRPQLQIGNMPTSGWNGRLIPTNMMSAFDRFLPCNSHHIPTESSDSANTGNTGTSAATTAATGHNHHHVHVRNHNMANRLNPRIILRAVPRSLIRGRLGTVPNVTMRPHLVYNPTSQSFRGGFVRLPTSRTNQNVATTQTATPAVGNNLGSNSRLRAQLLNFVVSHIFEGAPINAETMPNAVNRAVLRFGEFLLYLPQYEKPEYDSRDSLLNILRRTLPLFIEMVNDNNANETMVQFEQRLKVLAEQFVKRLYSVLHVCIGQANAEIYWSQLMTLLLTPACSIFRDEALQFIRIVFDSNIPANTDPSDAQQFIVLRSNLQTSAESSMAQDVEMVDVPTVSSASTDILVDLPEEIMAEPVIASSIVLPDVVTGSEAWHRNFPDTWLPIISRDLQAQAEQRPAPAPFSDTYISGMSAKRRRLIQNSKPPTDVQSLVADSVRKAIQTVGVTNSTASNQSQTPDEIIDAISSDNSVQSSYTEAVRTHVRERITMDPDYKASKYPQTSKFVNKK